jgi:hypothetical protein
MCFLRKSFLLSAVASGLAMALTASSSAQIWRLQEWTGYGGNCQHTAMSNTPAMTMSKILWSTPVDLDPQYSGSELLIHYAAPMVSYSGVALITVKTGATGGFQVEGHNVLNGGLLYTQTTDYVLPSSSWTPTCGSSLDGLYGMVTPGIGGTIYYRERTDMANSPVLQWAFYGLSKYTANKGAYNANVFICTPLTVDNAGNVYFGFRVNANSGTGLTSGIAKVTPAGTGTWISAPAAAGDSTITEPVINCAPALSNDQSTVYIAVSHGDSTSGYLVGLDTGTMTAKYSASLIDPRSGSPASLPDISTSTPLVGPDGDVYFGVFESPFYNDRGWMLHFDQTLTQTKVPGSFGWDNTPSIVPAQCVPSYKGHSSYLILTKYNNYAGLGPMGNGVNKVAILDPNSATPDPINGISNATNQPVGAMTQVITVTGPTPDPNQTGSYPNAVHEWCINSAAIDVKGKGAILNSEDGHSYRWNFATNTLQQTQTLSGGLGEAYTSTSIGKFGVVFCINNARIFAIGRQ